LFLFFVFYLFVFPMGSTPAGRVQRLIDARVLDHEAFQSFAAVIFEDAPIPMEIMEDEFNQESDIDIVLRESKHKADARITKTRGNAKHQKKDKKGYVENDWMREEDEMYKGMGGGGGSGGSGRRIVDKQLRKWYNSVGTVCWYSVGGTVLAQLLWC